MKRERVRHKDLTISRVQHNGMIEIYCLVDEHLVHRQYMGYPKREAVRLFLEEANGKEQMT